MAEAGAAPPRLGEPVRHIVLASFRDDALTADTVEGLRRELEALVTDLPGLLHIASGQQFATRGEHTFNWALVCVFADRGAADAYQTHPEHVRVRDRIVSLLRGPPAKCLCVLDFEDVGTPTRRGDPLASVKSVLESAGIVVATAFVVTKLLLRSAL